ncbi:hypothetical protein RRG08_003762 [Elysia crispata]|uniref:Uncharacterized protein n=1 Tax=Elysia crispata TaxID=231223 RepID=A0AAE1AWG5_9GAST|nr:hypothetical protein RRG08_003762 [Elysia crispata]
MRNQHFLTSVIKADIPDMTQPFWSNKGFGGQGDYGRKLIKLWRDYCTGMDIKLPSPTSGIKLVMGRDCGKRSGSITPSGADLEISRIVLVYATYHSLHWPVGPD